MGKFIKDIERASSMFLPNNTDYSDPSHKEDRIFINLYLLSRQLSWANFFLFIIAASLICLVFSWF